MLAYFIAVRLMIAISNIARKYLGDTMTLRQVFLICLLPATGLADASSLTLEQTAKNLNPSVQSVFMCGRWQYKRESGSFRIIYGWLWGHTEIYIQWLADPIIYPEKGQKERQLPLVIKTVSLPEYDDYESATDLENIKCSLHGENWVITADADNANDDDPKSAKYSLSIQLFNEPGRYKLLRSHILSR